MVLFVCMPGNRIYWRLIEEVFRTDSINPFKLATKTRFISVPRAQRFTERSHPALQEAITVAQGDRPTAVLRSITDLLRVVEANVDLLSKWGNGVIGAHRRFPDVAGIVRRQSSSFDRHEFAIRPGSGLDTTPRLVQVSHYDPKYRYAQDVLWSELDALDTASSLKAAENLTSIANTMSELIEVIRDALPTEAADIIVVPMGRIREQIAVICAHAPIIRERHDEMAAYVFRNEAWEIKNHIDQIKWAGLELLMESLDRSTP